MNNMSIKRRVWKINNMSAIFFFLIAALITIMIYLYALDVEYLSYYSRRVEPLSDMELRYIKEYRIFKHTPELSAFDFNNRIARQRASALMRNLNSLRKEKAMIAARMTFRKNVLFTGLISFFCLAILSYIVARNQNRKRK